MKSLFVVSALGLLLSAQSQLAQAQSISITTTGGCTISGITALTSTGANTFQATGGTTSGTCSTTGGGSGTIVVTLIATPNTITLGSSSLTSTISMSATGAVNCTLRDTTGALSLASPAMSGTSGSTVATAVGSTSGSDTVTGTCTDASSAGATVTVISTSVTLAPAGGGGGGSTACTGTETSDTSYVLTRTCSGQVGYNDYAPAYSGNIFNFSDVYGAWPAAAAYLGKTAIIPLAKNQFVSLVLSPTNSGTINLVGNPSYGSSAISVSTSPGGFTFGSSKGTVCASLRGGSSGVVISNNGTAADCQLNPSLTYYINMGYVGATTTSPTGSTCTRSTTCYASFTLYKLN